MSLHADDYMLLHDKLAGMEGKYSLHGHTRSVSSLASSILPMPSDASTFTSVTASPMDPNDPGGGPMELELMPDDRKCFSENTFALKTPPDEREQELELKAPMKDVNVREHLHSSENTLFQESDIGELTKLEQDWPPTSRSPPVSLEDLVRLHSDTGYQKRRALSAAARMDQLALSNGLGRRLTRTLWVAYGNMIDQYKTDDQAGFRGLYEASDRLNIICHNTQTTRTGDSGSHEGSSQPRPSLERCPSWIRTLSVLDRRSILALLSQIRANSDFLADRLANLSPVQLAALTSSYHPAGIDLSILANHSHGATDLYSQDSQMMKLSRRMDNLRCFHAQDPFFIMIYCCFDASAKPGSCEYIRRNAVWSSICAKLIMQSKAGSDEFIIAVADAFMGFEAWKVRPELEIYLLETLSAGLFLGDPPSNPEADLGNTTLDGIARNALRESEFFDAALSRLFRLLASELKAHFLPRTCLDFICSTLRDVPDPELRRKAKVFLITRWYFASLLSSVLMYPELHGIAMTHQIGHAARRKILNEIVVRMQVQVFDVLDSRNNDSLVQNNKEEILAIFDSFEPSQTNSPFGTSQVIKTSAASDQDASGNQVMLCSQDVTTLIQTLYPQDLSQSVPESEVDSTPPSTTSSSTLRPDSVDLESSSWADSCHISSSVSNDTATAGDGQLESFVGAHGLNPGVLSAQGSFVPNASTLWRVQGKLQPSVRTTVESENDAAIRDWCSFHSTSDGTVYLDLPDDASRPQSLLSTSENDDVGDSTGPRRDYLTIKTAVKLLLTMLSDGRFDGLPDPPSPGEDTPHDSLSSLFESAGVAAELDLDFSAAHYWWTSSMLYQKLRSDSVTFDLQAELFSDVAQELRANIQCYSQRALQDEAKTRSLAYLDKLQKSQLSELDKQRKALRIKMWYVSDVRNSDVFEEFQLVTQALRAMRMPKRRKQSSSMSNWARQRLKGPLSNERATRQTMELITASRDYGDQMKLADDQIEMTANWMEKNGVENFCAGEEVIHRFCYQIQKSVDRLVGTNILDSPVLWSSNLFKRERAAYDTRAPRQNLYPLRMESTGTYQQYHGRIATYAVARPSPLQSSSTGSILHGNSSLGPQPSFPSPYAPYHVSQPAYPRQTSLDSMRPHARPMVDIACARSNRVNGVSSSTRIQTQLKDEFIDNLKQALRGLLISEGGLGGQYDTETDAWIGKALTGTDIFPGSHSADTPPEDSSSDKETPSKGQETPNSLTDPVQIPQSVSVAPPTQDMVRDRQEVNPLVTGSKFSFQKFYKIYLQRISLTQDPRLKLQILYELEKLVIQDIKETCLTQALLPGSVAHHDPNLDIEPMNVDARNEREIGNLRGVVASCTQRRASILQSRVPNPASNTRFGAPPAFEDASTTADAIVQKLLSIFRDQALRINTLYRDLQFIAAFVPASTLDRTPQGKAFWNAGLAALALKEELCNSTIQRAADITTAHITSKSPPPPPHPTLQDAAHLWLIAAKEGSPIAARELGLFYLTHPDILHRVTMPFAKTGEIYKSITIGEHHGVIPAGGAAKKERGALDPLTFAVVFHWMEVAANGGDAEAEAFLRQGDGG